MTPVPYGSNRPLRVAVVGSSVGYFVRPPAPDRHGGPYAEWASDLVAAAGTPVTITNRCRWLGQIDGAFREIEPDLIASSPDVVIINFGWMECQPKVLPTALLRWTTTYRPSLNRYTLAVRARVSRGISWFYKAVTPRVAARWPRVPSRMPPARFEAELVRYIRAVRREIRSLVLVMNVNPTTDRVEEVLPTVNRRTVEYSGIVERVVNGFEDAQVRLIDSRSLVLEHGHEAVLPDGIHFNVEGHRLMAEVIAAEIGGWLGKPSCDGSEDDAARPQRADQQAR